MNTFSSHKVNINLAVNYNFDTFIHCFFFMDLEIKIAGVFSVYMYNKVIFPSYSLRIGLSLL